MRNDLIKKLQDWIEEGDRIILCIHTNEDMYKKILGKPVTTRNGLNMSEVVGTFTGKFG